MPIEQLQALIGALVEPDVTQTEVTCADRIRPAVAPFDDIGDATDEFDLEPTIYLIRPRVSTFDQLIAVLSKP